MDHSKILVSSYKQFWLPVSYGKPHVRFGEWEHIEQLVAMLVFSLPHVNQQYNLSSL
jgi:hypothetical protein